MRLKELGNQWRVYMNRQDYQRLLDHADDADDRRTKLALELGGKCGLRVNETGSLKRGQWRDSTHPDVDQKFLKIWGKDTRKYSEGKKFREVFMPRDVYKTVAQHIVAEQIHPDEQLFSVSKRTLQKNIKDTAKEVAEETGNEDYAKISSHDLRAYFATDRLIRRDVNIEVVMATGGWENRHTMEPYLHAAFDDVIAEEFHESGIA